jgi:hypothetical protein
MIEKTITQATVIVASQTQAMCHTTGVTFTPVRCVVVRVRSVVAE